MRGCDKFCTFCIVPFTRGRERSRSIEGITEEVKNAVSQGYSEITLLGQNVNSYDYETAKFPELLDAVAKVEGVRRIRYTSPHPQDINQELLEVMHKHHNICNYIHLPLQSGSNRILKRMNRTYTREHFIDLSRKIRSTLPGVGISTDIIVGFPGETEEDFNDTINLMNEVKFDSAYTFKYSPRKGTKATEYDDHIDENIKQDRLAQVIVLQKSHTIIRNKKYEGNIEDVLIEKTSKRNEDKWAGRTDSNKWVVFDKSNYRVNDIVPVLITKSKNITLYGEISKKFKVA
jgi:tRNA-2-methylthio-N6-dimethylallyladenosine synthase